MLRSVLTGLMVCAAVSGCGLQPVQEPLGRYCSVYLPYEPCLTKERTGNCEPCPDAGAETTTSR